MKIATTITEVREWRREVTSDVGLVPTMGYLHDGHLSLLRRARSENARVAASIFVNPTQFAPGEDYARYPRDLARDFPLLEGAGCDLVFAPSPGEMYARGAETVVEVGSVATPLEGERRPGHFRGVATVVLKLFGIVQPTRAYFGQKDAQQLAVLRQMVADLNVPVEVVGCTTVRAEDGLALSSRNSYLSPEERRAAPALYRALVSARDRYATGERRADELRRAMIQVLAAEPLARIDYVSVADAGSLRELDVVSGTALLSLAVRIGSTRLIDNLIIEG